MPSFSPRQAALSVLFPAVLAEEETENQEQRERPSRVFFAI